MAPRVDAGRATLPSDLRVLASDYNADGGALLVSALDLVNYPATDTFESRVFDAGTKVVSWGALTAEGNLEGVTFQTRSSDDQSNWSDWQALAGDTVASPVRRYLQYRATLTSDGTSTPSVARVTIAYVVDDVAPSVAISGVAVSGTTATVSFSSPDTDVARFECSLDGGAFTTCTSPKVYSGLTAGNHTVAVRAIDRKDNTGAAITRTFTINVTPPRRRRRPRHQRPGGQALAALGPRVAERPRLVPGPLPEDRDPLQDHAAAQARSHGRHQQEDGARLNGGKRATITLRLTKKYRGYLTTHKRLKTKAVTVAYDAANNRKTTRVKVTVRAPKRS